jgi:hypothetical protein
MQQPDGSWLINKKPFGRSSEPCSMEDVVEQFYEPVDGWPIRFKRAVARQLGGAGETVATAAAEAEPAPAAAIHVKARDTTAAAASNVPSGLPIWLHGPMEKDESSQILTDGCGGTVKHGAFFVRERIDHPGEFVLCCGFAKDGGPAKPTHHHVTAQEEDGVFVSITFSSVAATLVALIVLLDGIVIVHILCC